MVQWSLEGTFTAFIARQPSYGPNSPEGAFEDALDIIACLRHCKLADDYMNLNTLLQIPNWVAVWLQSSSRRCAAW